MFLNYYKFLKFESYLKLFELNQKDKRKRLLCLWAEPSLASIPARQHGPTNSALRPMAKDRGASLPWWRRCCTTKSGRSAASGGGETVARAPRQWGESIWGVWEDGGSPCEAVDGGELR
jgi:hypothetical protein